MEPAPSLEGLATDASKGCATNSAHLSNVLKPAPEGPRSLIASGTVLRVSTMPNTMARLADQRPGLTVLTPPFRGGG